VPWDTSPRILASSARRVNFETVSELELVEEPEDAPEKGLPEIEYLRPLGLPEEPTKRSPLRIYTPHEAPDGWVGIVARGLQEGVVNPIVLVYAFCGSLPLFAQRVPWVDQPLPWPGQAMCSFMLCFCLLERARASKHAEREMDVIDLPSILWRTLVFLFPLALGVGSLPLSAYAVIPVLFLFLPLFLGTMASDVWGEFHPRALWAAFGETPNYLATAVVSGLALAAGTWSVWGFPDGQAFLRGIGATLTYAFAGAVIGAARRDAELLGNADDYY
jgi:hypothetical protein